MAAAPTAAATAMVNALKSIQRLVQIMPNTKNIYEKLMFANKLKVWPQFSVAIFGIQKFDVHKSLRD